MNRLGSANLAGIRPDLLPAPGPRPAGAPVRILFLTTGILGFTTLSRQLQSATSARPDVDATHVLLTLTGRRRAVARHIPGLFGYDMHSWRYLRAAGGLLRSWLGPGGPLDARRFDIVHVATQGIAGSMPRIARDSGVPYALYIDATATSEVRDFGRRPGVNTMFIREERALFGHAALVSAMSEWAGDSLCADYGLPADRVNLCRPGLRMPEARVPARSPGEFRIAFVGNDWRRKGGQRLVDWHQSRWVQAAQLHILSSSAPASLRSLPGVVVHERFPRKQLLREVLPSMDLFVLPTWEDTVVWALVESAGAGVPAVASRLAGIPEVVLDGRTGLLCQRDDDAAFISAIERLMADADLRTSMGAAARAHIRSQFDPSRWYNVLLDRLVDQALPAEPGR